VIDLARLVDEARDEELPEVAAALELARVKLALRLASPAAAAAPAPQGKTLTPVEAAELARASKRQIYDWLVGKRWARRPTRRKLLIDRHSQVTPSWASVGDISGTALPNARNQRRPRERSWDVKCARRILAKRPIRQSVSGGSRDGFGPKG
jgi:hypothetical protein